MVGGDKGFEGQDTLGDFVNQLGCASDYHFWSFVLYGFAHGLFICVERQVIVVSADFFYRNKERLIGALTLLFVRKIIPTGNDVGDVVVLDRLSFIVERESVGPHVVEPYFVGTSCSGLGKDKYGGRNSCVWLEHPGGH